MVELKTKITASGVLYIPKEIREAFGREMKVIPNSTAALFFPASATYSDILKSLQIITLDVTFRAEKEKAKQQTKQQLSNPAKQA